MPLGFERLNERTQRPNALINFIRTLPGPSSSIAENILNRVAAVCYPFMKANTILVQALEEFPFNNEFVGRNFNAGEVIQLVLRDRNGRWLPQRMVEMVMVHELAHCKQMNHSKAFWKVRDAYAVDLRALWGRGYTGEGLWGRGRDLDKGALQMSDGDMADVPEHLCGGTYGRRAKKRRRGGKEKERVSYAERKQRRILKKFGVNGQALGADEDTKVKLEGGLAKKGKPRVAGSARGRDLRAAAALARFDTVKKEEKIAVKSEELSDSETEDEFEDANSELAAVDVDGKRMVDDKGHALVKICEDEDDSDGDARRELAELQDFAAQKQPLKKPSIKTNTKLLPLNTGKTVSANPLGENTHASSAKVAHLDKLWKRLSSPSTEATSSVSKSKTTLKSTQCRICSLENQSGSLTCAACSNVLDLRLVPDHWRCKRAACGGGQYVNSGDTGRCGVCGALRAVS